jgi:hypothetical protein
MAIAKIITTMTTIADQTQRSIGLGFHYQQGLGMGGFLFLVVIFGAHTRK